MEKSVREFKLRKVIPMRSVGRALGAFQHCHNGAIRFIGNPSGTQQEIVGMPTSDDTFVIYLRFLPLIEKASNFSDTVRDI